MNNFSYKITLVGMTKLIIFRNPRQAQDNLNRLTSNPFGGTIFQTILPEMMNILATVPDPDRSLNHFERLSRAIINQSSFFHFLFDYPQFLELLLTIFGHSNYLADILIRHPEYFYWLVTIGINQTKFDREAFLCEFENGSKQLSLIEKKISLLKRLKRREILRIGTLDIMGWIDLKTVTQNLSGLADAIIQSVYQIHLNKTKPVFGRVRGGLTVIGLGKLGGMELNYSSDIDIIFVYSNEGEGHRLDNQRSFSYHDYFNRLAEAIVHSLSQFSDGEALYRVDTRLRPDGISGPIARSIQSYLHYYELRGRIWERQMLIKARPIAGNQDIGKRFLDLLQPFIYPKTFFSSPLESIKEIKQTIEQKLLLRETNQTNIKLKQGGIRDIEFAVQALQLVNGGISPEIREKNTLKSIDKLEKKRLLSKSEATQLKEAYLFFRKIEHHLQLEDWRQTHLLPDDSEKLLVLAKKIGFHKKSEFESTVKKLSKQVREIYASILLEEKAPESESDSFEALLNAATLTPATRTKLAETGFQNPEQASKLISRLFSGTIQEPLPNASRKLFRDMLPLLLKKLKKQPAPDQALAQFVSFVKSYGSPQNLYALFLENDRVLDLTLQICGSTPLFAKLLITYPEFFSILTNPQALYEPFTRDHFSRRFREEISASMEMNWLRHLHKLKSTFLFQIGLQFVADLTSLEALFLSLSDLADITIETALSQILMENNSPDPFTAAIIGLGKLGSRELNFGSDLDVLFLTVENPEISIQKQEQILKTLISILNQITPTGQLYKIDARLRPEGSSAPLLISVETYKSYLQNRAELWERQMLLRSRLVAGSSLIMEKLSAFLQDYLFSPGLNQRQVNEIFGMLEKIHRKAQKKFSHELDLKNSPGGIVDIEFLIQMFQLKYGKTFTTLQKGTTIQLIEELGKLELMDTEDICALEEIYLFYRRVETYLHIGLERPRAKIPLQGEKLEFLAKLLHFKNGETLVKETVTKLKQTSQRIKSLKQILER